jgi:hypothetical protein
MQNKIHWSSYPFASESVCYVLLWILTESMCAIIMHSSSILLHLLSCFLFGQE